MIYIKTKVYNYIYIHTPIYIYIYIYLAQAVILTVERSLKRRTIKHITKQKEKTRESEKRSYKKEM